VTVLGSCSHRPSSTASDAALVSCRVRVLLCSADRRFAVNSNESSAPTPIWLVLPADDGVGAFYRIDWALGPARWWNSTTWVISLALRVPEIIATAVCPVPGSAPYAAASLVVCIVRRRESVGLTAAGAPEGLRLRRCGAAACSAVSPLSPG